MQAEEKPEMIRYSGQQTASPGKPAHAVSNSLSVQPPGAATIDPLAGRLTPCHPVDYP
jgi:hypothetical protein